MEVRQVNSAGIDYVYIQDKVGEILTYVRFDEDDWGLITLDDSIVMFKHHHKEIEEVYQNYLKEHRPDGIDPDKIIITEPKMIMEGGGTTGIGVGLLLVTIFILVILNLIAGL